MLRQRRGSAKHTGANEPGLITPLFELDVLSQIAQALANETDITVLLQMILHHSLQCFNVDWAIAFLQDFAQATVVSRNQLPLNVEEYRTLTESPCELLLPNTQQPDSPLAALANRDGIGTILILPLILKNEIVGRIVFAHQSFHSYTPVDLQFARLLASQATIAIGHDRTRRVAQEQAAQNTRQRRFLENLIETAPIGIAVLHGQDHIFELANPLYCRYHRRDARPDAELLLGKPFVETDPAQGVDSVSLLDRVYREGETIHVHESRGVHPTLGEISASFTLVPLSTTGGRIEGVLLVTWENTAEIRAKNESDRRAMQLETIFNSMADGVYICDRDGNLVEVNQRGLELLGLHDRSQALRSCRDLLAGLCDVHGEELPPDFYPMLRALAGETFADEEYMLRTDHLACFSASGAPMFSSDGALTGAVVVAHDMTQHYRNERIRTRLLQENSRQRSFLERLIDTAPVGIAVVRGEKFIYDLANPLYRRYLPVDYDPVGYTFSEMHAGDDDAESLQDMINAVYRTGQPITINRYSRELPGVGMCYLSVEIAPLYDSGGDVDSVLIILADITSEIESQEKITRLLEVAQHHAAELEGVISSIAEGVAIIDRHGTVVTINEAGVELLGGTRIVERLLASSEGIFGIFYRQDGTRFAKRETPLERAIYDGEITRNIELLAGDEDNRHVVLVSAAPLHSDRQISGAVAVFHDISELKRVERMKDEFLSIASHELKTPLTSIKGYTQLLMRHARQKQDERLLRSLSIINSQTDHMVHLSNSLLDLSRIRSSRLELLVAPFNLETLARRIVERMQILSEEHRLELRILEGSTDLLADEERIDQVITNLIGNAIKYSPTEPPEIKTITITIDPRESEIIIAIHDEGIGIPLEQQAHLFERFYRGIEVKQNYGGLGLGLYISHEILTLHGGRLWVESAAGQGSTFYCSLPYRPPQESE